MLDLPQQGGKSMESIEVTETANVLDDILRSMYPSTKDVAVSSETHAVEVLRALEKYQIFNCEVADKAASYLGAIEPSVKAWAFALQTENSAARSIAVRRFIADSTTGLEGSIVELKSIDAWRLVRLVQIKQEALDLSLGIVNELINSAFCEHWDHRNFDSHAKARASPFDGSLLAEYVLASTIVAYSTPHCQYCRDHFWQASLASQRSDCRRRLENLMERAVLAESMGIQLGEVQIPNTRDVEEPSEHPTGK